MLMAVVRFGWDLDVEVTKAQMGPSLSLDHFHIIEIAIRCTNH